jgi:hypothetical protein
VSAPDAGDRIGAFCVGLSVAALCAFLAWLSFGLLIMLANPDDPDGGSWALVRERAEANPALIAFLVLCCAGALFGAALMCRAALGRPRS